VTGRRDGHFEIKWHLSQPVQRVAEFTPEPSADNSDLRGVFLFPKSASGSSGKLRENKGNDMADDMKETLRKMFFDATCISQDYREGLEWGQRHIEYLEQHARDMGELLEQREKEFADLQSHLQERNATIDRLEAELQDNRTHTRRTHTRRTLSSMMPESDEDRHQRHRRERMLDEVTLICVRNGIERMNSDPFTEKIWGRLSLDTANSICYGFDEFDAKQ